MLAHISLINILLGRYYSIHIVDEETEIEDIMYFINVACQINGRTLIQNFGSDLIFPVYLVFPLYHAGTLEGRRHYMTEISGKAKILKIVSFTLM